MVFKNCLIKSNSAIELGGGFRCLNFASLDLDTCTITGNTVNSQGGGLHILTGNHSIRNSILWGDSSAEGNQAYLSGACTVTFAHSDVDTSSNGVYAYPGGNSEVIWGPGNLHVDPQFADPAGGDYHLLSSSPCIDAGYTRTCRLAETDLDGEPRVMDGRMDIGVDEFTGEPGFLYGDPNCDGAFNGADIDPFFMVLGDTAEYYRQFPNCHHMLADMNSDGWVNGADIDPFVELLTGG